MSSTAAVQSTEVVHDHKPSLPGLKGVRSASTCAPSASTVCSGVTTVRKDAGGIAATAITSSVAAGESPQATALTREQRLAQFVNQMLAAWRNGAQRTLATYYAQITDVPMLGRILSHLDERLRTTDESDRLTVELLSGVAGDLFDYLLHHGYQSRERLFELIVLYCRHRRVFLASQQVPLQRGLLEWMHAVLLSQSALADEPEAQRMLEAAFDTMVTQCETKQQYSWMEKLFRQFTMLETQLQMLERQKLAAGLDSAPERDITDAEGDEDPALPPTSMGAGNSF